jgi:hypothetical protein
VLDVPPFPTVQDLDNEFDGWPESGNPFVEREMPITLPTEPRPMAFSNTPPPPSTMAVIFVDIIRSEDKLFFIAYSQERSQCRNEWKLVRVDFKSSLQKNPGCLQNGRFLMEFFVQRHRDSTLDIRQRRFWLEYHTSNSHKTLSTSYHIIQPSQYSEQIALDKNLVSYREWIQLNGPSICLHGPFDFAFLHNRKTRDRVAETDWRALISGSSKFDNSPPQFFPQPIFETISMDDSVTDRCRTFMLNLEFSKQTLNEF